MSFLNPEIPRIDDVKNLSQLVSMAFNFTDQYNRILVIPIIDETIERHLVLVKETISNNLFLSCGHGVTQIISRSMDTLFLTISGFICIFMNSGYILEEVALVRIFNNTTILTNNIFQFIIGGLAFYLLGFSICWGKSAHGIVGIPGTLEKSDLPLITEGSLSGKLHERYSGYDEFMYDFGLVMTFSFILSSVTIGRTNHITNFIQAILVMGVLCPMFIHWSWHWEGWMVKILQYQDLAGSGVLHSSAGAAALAASMVLGRRIVDQESALYASVPISSPAILCVGFIMLSISHIICSCAAIRKMSQDCSIELIGSSVINCLMGMIGGGLTGMFVMIFIYRRPYETFPEMVRCLTCSLAGQVSILGGASSFTPSVAMVIAAIGGGLNFIWAEYIKDKLNIEDAIDSTSIHFLPGIWGVVSMPIFNMNTGFVKYLLEGRLSPHWSRIFFNLSAVLILDLVAFLSMFCLFILLDIYGILRLPSEKNSMKEFVDFRGFGHVKHHHHQPDKSADDGEMLSMKDRLRHGTGLRNTLQTASEEIKHIQRLFGFRKSNPPLKNTFKKKKKETKEE